MLMNNIYPLTPAELLGRSDILYTFTHSVEFLGEPRAVVTAVETTAVQRGHKRIPVYRIYYKLGREIDSAYLFIPALQRLLKKHQALFDK